MLMFRTGQSVKCLMVSCLALLLSSYAVKGFAQSASTRLINLEQYYREYHIQPYQAKTHTEGALLHFIYQEESLSPRPVPYVVTRLALVGSFAYLSWRQGAAGGYGVYRKDQVSGQWQQIGASGAGIDYNRLIKLGIPDGVAQQLTKSLREQI